MENLRKYNTATDLYAAVVKAGSDDFAVTADWTPAAGDVKVIKDGGAPANITTLPTEVGAGVWKFPLSATEMSAAKVQVVVVDAAVKAVKDLVIYAITYGNVSAELAPDLKDAVRIGLTALPNAAAAASGGLPTVDAANGVTLRTSDSPIVHTGTAQAGSASTITLAAGASATDGLYGGLLVRIVSGTGAGQVRRVLAYVGSTKVVTTDRAWTTNPDATSVYTVLAESGPFYDVASAGTAQAGAATTITLQSNASATDGFYVGQLVVIRSGTGAGQARVIIAYVGATKVATVNRAWVTNPASGSVYVTVGVDAANVDANLRVALQERDQFALNVGTAQAGAASTITLAATASATNDLYKGAMVKITSGTGSGQARRITGYVGSTKVATVERAWATNPDATSVYGVMADVGPAVDTNLAVAAGTNTVAEREAIVDAFFGRNIAGGSNGGRTLYQALAFLRNKWVVGEDDILRVYGTDDTTILWQAPVTRAIKNQITSMDPA